MASPPPDQLRTLALGRGRRGSGLRLGVGSLLGEAQGPQLHRPLVHGLHRGEMLGHGLGAFLGHPLGPLGALFGSSPGVGLVAHFIPVLEPSRTRSARRHG